MPDMDAQDAGVRLAGLLLAGGLALCPLPVAAGSLPAGFAVVTAKQLRWQDMPDALGAQIAVVEGDPDKPGIYVIRVRFPPHVMDMPHFHSRDRHVTVLEGTWFAGTGPVFDPARAEPLPPGSYMLHPASGVHWDGSAGDETVVVQIIGMGPLTTTQAHPAGPDWVRVR